MENKYTTSRLLAIIAGTAATFGALAILCGDALATGHWSLEHLLMPVIVGITILAGHLIGTALRSLKILSAAGFAALFVMGTGLTIYTSVGRQAKTADTEVAVLENDNAEIVRLKASAVELRKTLDYATPDAKTECKGAPNPLPPRGWPECRRKSSSVEAFNEKLEKIEARLTSLGAPKPVAPRAGRAAEVMSVLFGIDEKKAKHALMLFEPFFFSLFLELTAIVAFGYGFGSRRQAKPARVVITPDPGPVVTATKVIDRAPSVERRAAVHSFVAAHAARHSHAPQIPAIQAMHRGRFGFELPKTTAWNWRAEAIATLAEPVRHLRIVG